MSEQSIADRSAEPTMSFTGTAALITGASGGMGFTIARDLLIAGARVTLTDLKAPDDTLLAALKDFGDAALFLRGDITEEAFVADLAQQAFAHGGGRLDHLVNAAGLLWFGRDQSLVEVDLSVWDQVLAVNLRGMMLCCRAAVPLMKATGSAKTAPGGAMVQISSIQALRGDYKPQDAYQAAKAAVIALSKSLAIQFAGDGIRSNSLLPGGALTGMQQRWLDDPEALAAAAAGVPLGRVGTSQDMADAALFLLSNKASFITGIELIVDGGRTALP